MKVIIAGSRGVTNIKEVFIAVAESNFNITQVISGCAKGVDTLGEEFAAFYNINVLRFPAEWDKYGRSAGYIRNQAMAEVADALIAIWDGESKGTKHMIDIAYKKGLKVYIHNVDKRYL